MDTSKIRVELTISGFFYLIALLFVFLKILDVENLDFIVNLKDYFLYISAATLISSYILGLVGHRLTPLLLKMPARLLEAVFRKNGMLVSPESDIEDDEEYFGILQLGSDHLVEDIQSKAREMTLLKTLVVAVPLAGISFFVWAVVIAPLLSYAILVLTLLMDVGLLLSYVRHRVNYFRFRKITFREIKKIKNDQRGKSTK